MEEDWAAETNMGRGGRRRSLKRILRRKRRRAPVSAIERASTNSGTRSSRPPPGRTFPAEEADYADAHATQAGFPAALSSRARLNSSRTSRLTSCRAETGVLRVLEALNQLPRTPHHVATSLAFTNDPKDVAVSLDRFLETQSKKLLYQSRPLVFRLVR